MNVNIQISKKVFNKIYIPYLENVIRTQIFFGGSSAGKSVFIAQRCVIDVLENERNYLIIRNTANTLRTSVFNEIRRIILSFGLVKLFKINKTEMTITCITGYQILFRGLDDAEKLKSIIPEKGVITDILIEEATETKRDDIKQLYKRLRGLTGGKHKIAKRLTMAFNPIIRTHWIFKEYFKNWVEGETEYHDGRLSILKTTYKDNRFLEQDDIDELENEQDPYYRDVYTLGNWGILGDLIFTNWKIEDLSKIKNTFGAYYNGLDFGFSNDPSAAGRQAIKGKVLYILQELLYEKGLTNDVIAGRLKPAIGKEYIRCDSSEPKSIAELRGYGIEALAARKGPGSVNFGIQYLKQFNIIIDRKCQNAINEIQLYQWKKDKDGNVINVPVDKFNHFMDQVRYALNDRIYEREEEKPYTAEEIGIF
ncbi:PBSX family phage terminase large subunit [Candidatus Atribacteria bacterium 1244-E10-H5-B2]|nr:MAG: PBSX family phage terminase large subunit [Candidatus Atribacteria bacterium 1244-E10-H5-B2]